MAMWPAMRDSQRQISAYICEAAQGWMLALMRGDL